jgi:hypothetical protein
MRFFFGFVGEPCAEVLTLNWYAPTDGTVIQDGELDTWLCTLFRGFVLASSFALENVNEKRFWNSSPATEAM